MDILGLGFWVLGFGSGVYVRDVDYVLLQLLAVFSDTKRCCRRAPTHQVKEENMCCKAAKLESMTM